MKNKKTISSSLMENVRKKQNIKKYFWVYTALFGIMAILAFSYFIISGKSFVWNIDGYRQNYLSLRYFGVYCRNIIKTLFTTGALVIPHYDYSIGYGMDVLTTFNYYVIGDPLSILSVFVPAKFTVYLYCFLCAFRMYLAGLAFSLFSKKTINSSFWGTFIGSVSYAFCGYALLFGIRHPYFANPMIYLPLVLLGIEYIFKGKKPYLFILMIFISACSSFYFFYQICVFMVIYAVFRFFMIYKKNILKNLFSNLLKFAVYSVIGVLLSGFIFIPVVMAMLGTNRAETQGYLPLLYDFSYYRDFLLSYITPQGQYSAMLCYTPVTIISVIVMHIKAKENKHYVIGFWLLTAFLMLPIFAYIFNGFSYVVNRWTWVYSLLVSLITASNFAKIKSLTKKQWSIVGGALLLFPIALLVQFVTAKNIKSYYALAVAILVCSFAVLFYFCNKKVGKKAFTRIVIALVIISTTFSSYSLYAHKMINYQSEFFKTSSINRKLNDTTTKCITKLNDNSYYRFDSYDCGQGNDTNYNDSALKHTNFVGGYYSINSPSVSNLYEELNDQETREQLKMGLKSKAMISTLASVKYFITEKGKNDNLPYGFNKKVSSYTSKISGKKYNCYENEYALPIGYAYDNVISYDDYAKLSATQKQQAMLQGAVLDSKDIKNTGVSINNNLHYTDKTVSSKFFAKTKNIVVKDNKIITSKAHQKIEIDYEGLPNSEVYLRLSGFKFVNIDSNELKKLKLSDDGNLFTNAKPFSEFRSHINVISGGVRHAFWMSTNKYTYHSDRTEYDVSIKYSKNGSHKAYVMFEKPGIYNFDSISVECVPMTNYVSDVTKLKNNSLENIKVDTDYVSGTTDFDTGKLLTITLPYSDGWSAYVDGKKVDVIKANIAFMGISVPAGKHQIELKYQTPYSHFGYAASGLGFVSVIAVVLIERIKTKRKVEDK